MLNSLFYMAARVRDNVHDVANSGESSRWWQRDAVTLFLDISVDGDGNRWIPGDHGFALAADPSAPDDAIWCCHGDAGGIG